MAQLSRVDSTPTRSLLEYPKIQGTTISEKELTHRLDQLRKVLHPGFDSLEMLGRDGNSIRYAVRADYGGCCLALICPAMSRERCGNTQ